MGGSDKRSNLCLLTAKEHFLAHRLLVKIHPTNSSMAFALFNMTRCSKGQQRKFTMRQYAVARMELSKAMTRNVGRLNTFYGKIHTEETKVKIRNNRPNVCGELNPNFGNRWTREQKESLSKKKKGVSNTENQKSILQVDKKTGKILNKYDSVTAASKATGLSVTHIAAAARGYIKKHKNGRSYLTQTAGGFLWKYKT